MSINGSIFICRQDKSKHHKSYASVEVPDVMEKEDVSLKMKTSFDIEEPLLYDSFSTGFVWGVATSAYQVSEANSRVSYLCNF